MESSSNSYYWDYVCLFLLRPFLAFLFVLSLIFLGWFSAWKLVLVHVPLVQEIFGLRKKPTKPKPPTLRLTHFYKTQNSDSGTWIVGFGGPINLHFGGRIYRTDCPVC